MHSRVSVSYTGVYMYIKNLFSHAQGYNSFRDTPSEEIVSSGISNMKSNKTSSINRYKLCTTIGSTELMIVTGRE